MPILKFLHIACMFLGVAFTIGNHYFLERVTATHDARAIRIALGTTRPIPILINGFLGAGALLGLVNAYFDQFNFFAPWLLGAYVIFIILAGLGGAVTGKWVAQMDAALSKDSGENLSPDVVRLLDEPMIRLVGWINIIGILIVIYLMVMKPGGI